MADEQNIQQEDSEVEGQAKKFHRGDEPPAQPGDDAPSEKDEPEVEGHAKKFH